MTRRRSSRSRAGSNSDGKRQWRVRRMGFVSDDNTGPLEAVEDAEEKREERNARGEGMGIDRW